MKKYIIAAVPGIILYVIFYYTHGWEINLALRDTGRISFLYITFSLLVTPIISLFDFQRLLPWRRVFWVISFLLAIAHFFIYFYLEKLYSNTFFVAEHFKQSDVITWIVGFILILILWLTSNNFSVKKLKWTWNQIQSLAYPLFIIVAIHVAFASRFDNFYMISITILALFRSVAYYKKWSTKIVSTKALYECVPCGYIYDWEKWDPDGWISPWTKFEDIPNTWRCPVCWVGKEDFILLWEQDETKQYLDTKIVSKKYLTADVIELEVYTMASLRVLPGQHARFVFKDLSGDFIRSYSVVRYINWILTFCIKIDENWKWWKILKEIKIWDNITLDWIYGKFILKQNKNPKVFLATWTGIAPVIPMILNSFDSQNFLYFWVKKESDVFYEDEFKKMPNLNYAILCSELSENCNTYKRWRINVDEFSFPIDTEFYICGNPMMVKDSTEKLAKKGYTNIYFEQF